MAMPERWGIQKRGCSLPNVPYQSGGLLHSKAPYGRNPGPWSRSCRSPPGDRPERREPLVTRHQASCVPAAALLGFPAGDALTPDPLVTVGLHREGDLDLTGRRQRGNLGAGGFPQAGGGKPVPPRPAASAAHEVPASSGQACSVSSARPFLITSSVRGL